MNYNEKMQSRIHDSVERSEERTKLWKKLADAYEQGSIDQVESTIAEEMEGLKKEFESTLSKLQEIL